MQLLEAGSTIGFQERVPVNGNGASMGSGAVEVGSARMSSGLGNAKKSCGLTAGRPLVMHGLIAREAVCTAT